MRITNFVTPQHTRFVWLDSFVETPSRDPNAWRAAVQQHTGLWIDDFHMRDLLNRDHPSRFDLTKEYDFLVFRQLERVVGASTSNEASAGTSTGAALDLKTSAVHFIIAPHCLITVRMGESPIFTQLMGKWASPPAQGARAPESPLDLGLKLLNGLMDHYLELRSPLSQHIQNWQSQLLQQSTRFHSWGDLLQQSITLQQLQGLCEEQMDALQSLRDRYIEEIENEADRAQTELGNAPRLRHDLILVRFNDLIEHAQRVQQHAVRLEMTLKSAIDLHFLAASSQTNETMRFLTTLTAIFSPLGLLAGIYGMNFEIMPGLHQAYGFWWMLALMLAITATLIYYMHRKRILRGGAKSAGELFSRM